MGSLGEFLAFDAALLMQADVWVRLVLEAFLLLGSAFFSSSETALFSLSRVDLETLHRAKDPRYPALHRLLEQPRRLIISILCGNELINVAATANMAGILVSLYGEARAGILNIFIMVPLLLLFGEVTPKTIAVSEPVRLATRVLAVPLELWVRFVAPLRWVIRAIADRVTTAIVGEEKAAENILQLDELRTLVDEVVRGGELNASERFLIFNLLEAGTTEVVAIMTPRTQTTFLDADLGVRRIVEEMRRLRHFRVPLFRGSHDNLLGFVHAEDVLKLSMEDQDIETLSLEHITRPPIVVPPTKKVDEMFDFFLAHDARAAAVLNEFGGIEGLVTMNDVLKFIFGNFTARTGPPPYKELSEHVFEVRGDMKLNDFNDVTNFGITDPRMTTIGGVILRHLDRLPQPEDEVVVEGIVLKVMAMDGHRIAWVLAGKGGKQSVKSKPEDKASERQSD